MASTSTTVPVTTTTLPPSTVFPAGTKLLVKRRKSGTYRLQVLARSTDVAVDVAADPPCQVDGELVIEAVGAGTPAWRVPLEAGLWKPIKAKRPQKGCTYRKGAVVATATLKAGKMLKVIAKAADVVRSPHDRPATSACLRPTRGRAALPQLPRRREGRLQAGQEASGPQGRCGRRLSRRGLAERRVPALAVRGADGPRAPRGVRRWRGNISSARSVTRSCRDRSCSPVSTRASRDSSAGAATRPPPATPTYRRPSCDHRSQQWVFDAKRAFLSHV
jgi:hypothetical protein